jgi:hypothetical protein
MHVKMTACYFALKMPCWRNVVFVKHHDTEINDKNIDEDDTGENKKVKSVPAKVVWYFPIISRLR